MTADSNSVQIVDNLDSVPAMAPRTKTVEGRLKETLRNLAATEAKLHLFSILKRLGLGTNDIANFVTKQTIHKKVIKNVDGRVQRSAMQSKIMDAAAYAKRLRQDKNTLRQRIYKKYQGNKSMGKKVVADLLDGYRRVKSHEFAKADKKIQFYREKNDLEKSLKEVPQETSEFLNGVNIFSSDC